MTALQRFHKRRFLSGLSANQEVALPTGQVLRLSDAGRLMQGAERLTRIRWNVYAGAFAAHVRLIREGKLSLDQAKSFWTGEAGKKLAAYSESLARFPEAWAELERFSKQAGLGALPILAPIIYAALAGTAAYAAIEVIKSVNRVDYAKEERLKAQVELQQEAIERGMDPRSLQFQQEGGRSFLDVISSSVGQTLMVGLTGAAVGYWLWKRARPAVNYVQQKVKDRRFYGR